MDRSQIINYLKTKYTNFDFYLESYTEKSNEKAGNIGKDIDIRDFHLNKDKLGVTIYYPNKNKATHVKCFVLKSTTPINEFRKVLEQNCLELNSKIRR